MPPAKKTSTNKNTKALKATDTEESSVEEDSAPVEEPVEEPVKEESVVEETPGSNEDADVEEDGVEESQPVVEQKEETKASQATDYSPYVYKQKAVLYTDGLSGTADHNQQRAYDTSVLKADLHAENVEEDYLPIKDRNVAERERRDSGPVFDKVN
jgi:hypothetical protein